MIFVGGCLHKFYVVIKVFIVYEYKIICKLLHKICVSKTNHKYHAIIKC